MNRSMIENKTLNWNTGLKWLRFGLSDVHWLDDPCTFLIATTQPKGVSYDSFSLLLRFAFIWKHTKYMQHYWLSPLFTCDDADHVHGQHPKCRNPSTKFFFRFFLVRLIPWSSTYPTDWSEAQWNQSVSCKSSGGLFDLALNLTEPVGRVCPKPCRVFVSFINKLMICFVQPFKKFYLKTLPNASKSILKIPVWF